MVNIKYNFISMYINRKPGETKSDIIFLLRYVCNCDHRAYRLRRSRGFARAKCVYPAN